MKELLTIRSNFYTVVTAEKKRLPQVEVILVLSEPCYGVDASGQVVQQRETSQVRFATYPDSLRKLAQVLTGMADEADAEAESLAPQKTGDTPSTLNPQPSTRCGHKLDTFAEE